MIGISRPNLTPEEEYFCSECTDGWFMCSYNGLLYLYGNGKDNKRTDDETSRYK
jgi:hypothetical protein